MLKVHNTSRGSLGDAWPYRQSQQRIQRGYVLLLWRSPRAMGLGLGTLIIKRNRGGSSVCGPNARKGTFAWKGRAPRHSHSEARHKKVCVRVALRFAGGGPRVRHGYMHQLRGSGVEGGLMPGRLTQPQQRATQRLPLPMANECGRALRQGKGSLSLGKEC